MVSYHVAAQAGFPHRIYVEMEPSERHRKGVSPINLFVIALVLVSFVVFALETEPTVPDEVNSALASLNVAILVAFALEYAVRVWIAGEDPACRGAAGRIRYALKPYSIADLLAFLPELLWLTLAPQGPSETELMVLRILRLVRLGKIVHLVPAFAVLGAAQRRARDQLLTTLVVALSLVFVAAVVLYFIEGVGVGRSEFASIPRALWWAVATLTTVGYGDVYPITPLGRFAAAVIALAGIGVVALPAGVFASAFSDELRERQLAQLKSAMTNLEEEISETREEISETREEISETREELSDTRDEILATRARKDK
jgi:voltage-gated potassium channel